MVSAAVVDKFDLDKLAQDMIQYMIVYVVYHNVPLVHLLSEIRLLLIRIIINKYFLKANVSYEISRCGKCVSC